MNGAKMNSVWDRVIAKSNFQIATAVGRAVSARRSQKAQKRWNRLTSPGALRTARPTSFRKSFMATALNQMKILQVLFCVMAAASCACAAATATKPLRTTDVSFRNEVQRALEKGNDFLKSAQNSNGWWSTPDHPSVTALAVSAMMGEPGARLKNSPEVKKGYAFILSCVKPDGGIYVTNLANYNTSICMMGLLAARDPKHDELLRRARSFVAGMQADLGERGKMDSPWDGGIGYSHDAGRSDMNNTLTALEALYYSKHLVADKNLDGAKDLNWAAAIQFLQNCQNLPGANKQDWVSTDARDRGGFVYDPDSSKAGGVTNASGKVALALLWQHQLRRFAELHLRRREAIGPSRAGGDGLVARELFSRRESRHGPARILLLSAPDDEGIDRRGRGGIGSGGWKEGRLASRCGDAAHQPPEGAMVPGRTTMAVGGKRIQIW